METIRKVRLAHHRDHKSIREIARDFNLSRNTVRKIIRTGATEFSYERKVQPRPRLEPFKEQLAKYLTEDSTKPVKATAHGSSCCLSSCNVKDLMVVTTASGVMCRSGARPMLTER